MSNYTVLVFGATGAIGGSIVSHFCERGYEVYSASRSVASSSQMPKGVRQVAWDVNGEVDKNLDGLLPQLDAVVWAQGANCNDDIFSFNVKVHDEIYAANVKYILVSLQLLLQNALLKPGARLCVISSIWQNIARQQKLSYTISKSALLGLVQSLTIDLGKSGMLVNAVLPGAMDTPMTRANLTLEQIDKMAQMTPMNSLPTMNDVCSLVGFLCSQDNTGITGQFIAIDRGFSYTRII